ncbi:hypothetical protein [Leifsonia naganoensis]|uniref:Putative nucleic acid-binding Zn-ribbon protein n=1 Tax=Leifsonia naganoensis TaxID=150025 RepID=A0A853DGJ7_9MICO|nr:putative nucleic acid-binding Zn-ribbon protein [Leifsonia naganoensis]
MRRVLTRSAAVAVLVAGLVTAEVAGPAAAETAYPSWDEVAAAKANASSAQAQVDRINGLLAGLQSSANTAADAAIQRAAELGAAQAALQAAAQKATDLASQAATATSAADTLRRQSGTLAAQLSRGGGSDVSVRLFLSDSTATADSLLYQLGAVSKLAERSNALLQQATSQKNLASSLSAQAAAAQTVRQQRDADAKKAYDTAASAKAAADAAVADQQTRADTLYAQLASLKNTQASVERQYAEGEAARKAAEQSASSGGGGGGGSSGGGSGGGADSSAPPPGVVVDPAAAQAYAASRLPAYGWGGEQMSCLIKLWTKESSWRADAYNRSSGAYGIPQALPGSKMASAGGDWMTNADTQINWGLSYISGRYGSPCAAWSFHLGHNWY